MQSRPRILILGAGFGGLFAAKELGRKPVDVLLIDQNNYHTFTPLLYQVATCALDPSEIAQPVRSIFQRQRNIDFLFGEVTAIDLEAKCVTVQRKSLVRQEPYDYLIVATGSVPSYFGNDAFQAHALELRTLADAVRLRNHILRLFERASWEEDEAVRRALTTIVVVGGGPTGIETAGAIYELYSHVLEQDFHQVPLDVQVLLVEMQPYLLAVYPPELRESAKKQLETLGVKVLLEQKVVDVAADHIRLGDGSRLETHTLIWAAGMRASNIAEMLGVELNRAGQIAIDPTTAVPELPGVYAVGDIAYLEGPDGEPYPMLIPVAQQQGQLAAHNILADIQGKAPETFRYHDRGIMATIGRRRAVAWLYYRIKLSGWLAWLGWLGLHLVTLIGFRNRLNVFVNWVWNYFTYDRSVRLILDPDHEN